MKDIFIVGLSVLVAAARIGGMTSKSYQAVAHLWVGGLFVAWLMSKRWFYGAWFWALCVVEVIQASIDHDLIGKLKELF